MAVPVDQDYVASGGKKFLRQRSDWRDANPAGDHEYFLRGAVARSEDTVWAVYEHLRAWLDLWDAACEIADLLDCQSKLFAVWQARHGERVRLPAIARSKKADNHKLPCMNGESCEIAAFYVDGSNISRLRNESGDSKSVPHEIPCRTEKTKDKQVSKSENVEKSPVDCEPAAISEVASYG